MSILSVQGPGPQQPREVTAPLEILSLLKSLHANRTPLELHFEERSLVCQSFIVALDPRSSTLYIDELIPPLADKWVEQGEAFRIDAWLDGAHLRWDNVGGAKLQLDDGAPAFRLALPSLVIHHQKRGAFRARVQRSIDIRLELVQPGKKPLCNGELLDISATGCRIRLAGDQTESIQPGKRYEASQLQLEEGPSLELNVEIRYRRYQQALDETHVGLHFHQPPPTTQRQIDRFVNQLQREARQQTARDDLF